MYTLHRSALTRNKKSSHLHKTELYSLNSKDSCGRETQTHMHKSVLTVVTCKSLHSPESLMFMIANRTKASLGHNRGAYMNIFCIFILEFNCLVRRMFSFLFRE